MQHLFKSIVVTLVVAVATCLGLTQNAAAFTGADFVPGHIIDDAIFYDKSAMSVSVIQSFLESKIPICDINGNQPYYGTYGGVTYNGNVLRKNLDTRYPAPYTCVRDFYENTTTHENNIGRPTVIPAGSISAAQIIYNEAQNYSINPQVLLVLIQKESSLLTDDWPWPPEYKTSTGYGCPDTAACDSTYFGFYNQVHNAARQFRIYANNPTSYNYAIGANTIGYNPNAACGTKAVQIVDQATANLYIYTPYTPNQAALNNLYGSGDNCSAYGNRNFWRIFNDWFGSPIYTHYSFVSAINPPSQLAYGDSATTQVIVKNTSNETWVSDSNVSSANPHPHRLMMRGYQNTPFADTTDPAWLGTQNQVRMVEPSVAPGTNATFTFRVKAPQTTITNSALNMVLVKDGVAVYDDLGLQFVTSSVPDYAYNITSATTLPGIYPGDTAYITIKATNTGVKTWYSDSNVSAANPHPIRLATPYYKDSPFAFPRLDPAWLGTKNQIKLVEPSVAPGETGTFTAIFTGPYQQVPTYAHNFSLVLDGVKFIAGATIPVVLNTPALVADYSFVSAVNPPSIMRIGDTASPTVTIKNTGNMIWRNFDNKVLSVDGSKVLMGDVRLITNNPGYRDSLFAPAGNASWLNTKNQARMVEPIVGPGGTATFVLPLTAPSTTGKYTEYFLFGVDGLVIMRDLGLAYPITVTP